uniref:Uncharacterized protein n=1 Tax=Ascaris lumbricoides TaxID=6252 RepID=A0A0M3HT64_ASCLU
MKVHTEGSSPSRPQSNAIFRNQRLIPLSELRENRVDATQTDSEILSNSPLDGDRKRMTESRETAYIWGMLLGNFLIKI